MHIFRASEGKDPRFEHHSDHQSIYAWGVFCLHPSYITASLFKQILSPMSTSLLSYALSSSSSRLIFGMHYFPSLLGTPFPHYVVHAQSRAPLLPDGISSLLMMMTYHKRRGTLQHHSKQSKLGYKKKKKKIHTKKKTCIDLYLALRVSQPI